MIPETPAIFEEECLVQKGCSSLPVTENLEDPDNMGIACSFLFLLHRGNCLGRVHEPPGKSNEECIPACMFSRLAALRSCADHYKTCVGANCVEAYCNQAVSLHQHWKNCNKPTCHICSSTVDLIIENFCSFLGSKGLHYKMIIMQIKMASLEAKKRILKLNVSRDVD